MSKQQEYTKIEINSLDDVEKLDANNYNTPSELVLNIGFDASDKDKVENLCSFIGSMLQNKKLGLRINITENFDPKKHNEFLKRVMNTTSKSDLEKHSCSTFKYNYLVVNGLNQSSADTFYNFFQPFRVGSCDLPSITLVDGSSIGVHSKISSINFILGNSFRSLREIRIEATGDDYKFGQKLKIEAKSLARLFYKKSLKILSLEGLGLDDKAFQEIVSDVIRVNTFKESNEINSLDLSGNGKLSYDTVKSIVSFCKDLSELKISEGALTSAEIEKLKKETGKGNLQVNVQGESVKAEVKTEEVKTPVAGQTVEKPVTSETNAGQSQRDNEYYTAIRARLEVSRKARFEALKPKIQAQEGKNEFVIDGKKENFTDLSVEEAEFVVNFLNANKDKITKLVLSNLDLANFIKMLPKLELTGLKELQLDNASYLSDENNSLEKFIRQNPGLKVIDLSENNDLVINKDAIKENKNLRKLVLPVTENVSEAKPNNVTQIVEMIMPAGKGKSGIHVRTLAGGMDACRDKFKQSLIASINSNDVLREKINSAKPEDLELYANSLLRTLSEIEFKDKGASFLKNRGRAAGGDNILQSISNCILSLLAMFVTGSLDPIKNWYRNKPQVIVWDKDKFDNFLKNIDKPVTQEEEHKGKKTLDRIVEAELNQAKAR